MKARLTHHFVFAHFAIKRLVKSKPLKCHNEFVNGGSPVMQAKSVFK